MFRKSYNNSSSRFSRGGSSPKRSFRGNQRIRTMDANLIIKKTAVHVSPEAYVPTHSFDSFAICDELKQNIKTQGYVAPTPIQDQTIPALLTGRDVIGIANTGTGKTAAFLIPLINKVYFNRTERVLIVAPTRELAVQIQDELKAFTKGMSIFSVLCIGGVSMQPQIMGLKRNPDVVIGTPGRLKDLKNHNRLNFAIFNNIVLDEVDRMLDMGFITDVKFIISHLPKIRQSLFFSATLPMNIQGVIHAFVQNPITVSIKTQRTPRNIDEDVIKTHGRNKFDILMELLRSDGFEKVIVFGRTKWGIEKLSKQLIDQGVRAVALHGNKNQNQRQRALDEFKQDRASVLLATDIASRGLDINDVTHVINYDLPETYEDYVHRIGRTGRAEKKGIALTFVD